MFVSSVAFLALFGSSEPPPAPRAVSDAPVVSPATPATPVTPTTPATAPACVAPPSSHVVRVAVADPIVSGAPARLGPLFQAALTTELRKLKGVSVIGADEVRALLDAEAGRQAAGCSDAGCLAEIADALGADVLVTSTIAQTDSEDVLSMRRLDTHAADAKGVDRRFAKDDGDSFLASIGPAVGELFADHELRAGVVRGVDKEVALRLNPPPIPLWALVTTTAVSALIVGAGGGLGAGSALFKGQAQSLIDASAHESVPAATVRDTDNTAGNLALAANTAFVVGGVVAVGAGVLALFTDFRGANDAP